MTTRRFRRNAGLALLPLLALPLLLAPAAPAQADLIEELVAQVSESRLTGHIAALEYPRYTPADLERAADYITWQLETWGYGVTQQPYSYSYNLIARLEGTVDSEHVLVIGAHYDTVQNSPGADDNASGIAAMLEIARLLAGRNLPYTIEFVAFTLEEPGLLGSTYYVQQAVLHDMDIFGMICFDMIAYTCATPGCQQPYSDIPACFWVDPDGVNVGDYVAMLVNNDSADMLEDCAWLADTYVPDLPVVTMRVAGTGACNGFTRRSDHVPFWDAGIPALEFLDTYGARNPFYHTWNDRLSILDMAFCRQVTQSALALALRSEETFAPAQPATPALARLDGVFPNPFNPRTTVRVELADAADVSLAVFDVSGRCLRRLVEGRLDAGDHALAWDGRDEAGRALPSGVYAVRLDAGATTQTCKAVLIR